MPDIKNLPAKGFPHEYDTISITASAATTITLMCEGVETKMTLTPDGAGVVALHGFAAILRDLTSDGKPRTFNLSVGSQNYSFKVLPCKIDLAVSTADFIARHFLTLQRGRHGRDGHGAGALLQSRDQSAVDGNLLQRIEDNSTRWIHSVGVQRGQHYST